MAMEARRIGIRIAFPVAKQKQQAENFPANSSSFVCLEKRTQNSFVPQHVYEVSFSIGSSFLAVREGGGCLFPGSCD